MPDYKDIRFLESTSNLRQILSRNSGRELSLERANQISVCLEQGRLLFEAAQNVAWEIKPLLVYYGMVGFAKAIFLSRKLAKLESLPQRHGLTDISESLLIEEMRVRMEKGGTFQGLNDSCSELEGLIFHDRKRNKLRFSKRTSKSESFEGKEITLKDILARIPELESLYRKTFMEEPRVVHCSHFSSDDDYEGLIEFGVHDFLPFTDLSSLELSVRDLRRRFPFLENWRVIYAAPRIAVKFGNLVRDGKSEFSTEVLEERLHVFYLNIPWATDPASGSLQPSVPLKFKLEELADHCQPIRGNLTPAVETTYLIESWNELFLTELCLYYVGMFLLSSLVRYRPHSWANAIARRSFPEKHLDDRALVLIEEFVDLGLKVFPEATVIAINEPFS